MRRLKQIIGGGISEPANAGLSSTSTNTASQELPSGSLEGRTIGVDKMQVLVLNTLAQGGFAFVYACRCLRTNNIHALKHMICTDDESLEIAQKEIQTLLMLQGHPNVVNLVNYASSTRVANNSNSRFVTREFFLVLEYCEKSMVGILSKCTDGTTSEASSSSAPSLRYLSEKFILSAFRDVCLAVQAMHAQDPPIAHRDLKVENVLQGADGKFKVCDFGSVSFKHGRIESAAEMGREEDIVRKQTTPAYRAPELWDLYSRDIICEKVDIWALGCLLYRLCFLQSCFDGNSKLQILNANYKIPQTPTLNPLLTSLIRNCLTVEVDKRPDIHKVLHDVEFLLSNGASHWFSSPLAPSPPSSTLPNALSASKSSASNTPNTRPNTQPISASAAPSNAPYLSPNTNLFSPFNQPVSPPPPFVAHFPPSPASSSGFHPAGANSALNTARFNPADVAHLQGKHVGGSFPGTGASFETDNVSSTINSSRGSFWANFPDPPAPVAAAVSSSPSPPHFDSGSTSQMRNTLYPSFPAFPASQPPPFVANFNPPSKFAAAFSSASYSAAVSGTQNVNPTRNLSSFPQTVAPQQNTLGGAYFINSQPTMANSSQFVMRPNASANTAPFPSSAAGTKEGAPVLSSSPFAPSFIPPQREHPLSTFSSLPTALKSVPSVSSRTSPNLNGNNAPSISSTASPLPEGGPEAPSFHRAEARGVQELNRGVEARNKVGVSVSPEINLHFATKASSMIERTEREETGVRKGAAGERGKGERGEGCVKEGGEIERMKGEIEGGRENAKRLEGTVLEMGDEVGKLGENERGLSGQRGDHQSALYGERERETQSLDERRDEQREEKREKQRSAREKGTQQGRGVREGEEEDKERTGEKEEMTGTNLHLPPLLSSLSSLPPHSPLSAPISLLAGEVDKLRNDLSVALREKEAVEMRVKELEGLVEWQRAEIETLKKSAKLGGSSAGGVEGGVQRENERKKGKGERVSDKTGESEMRGAVGEGDDKRRQKGETCGKSQDAMKKDEGGSATEVSLIFRPSNTAPPIGTLNTFSVMPEVLAPEEESYVFETPNKDVLSHVRAYESTPEPSEPIFRFSSSFLSDGEEEESSGEIGGKKGEDERGAHLGYKGGRERSGEKQGDSQDSDHESEELYVFKGLRTDYESGYDTSYESPPLPGRNRQKSALGREHIVLSASDAESGGAGNPSVPASVAPADARVDSPVAACAVSEAAPYSSSYSFTFRGNSESTGHMKLGSASEERISGAASQFLSGVEATQTNEALYRDASAVNMGSESFGNNPGAVSAHYSVGGSARTTPTGWANF